MAKNKQIPHYEFLKDFPTQKPQPVYYIVGNDTYLRDLVAKTIRQKFSPSETNDFDFAIFYGDENCAAQALEQLEMSPFLADIKLVIIKSFDAMNAANKKLIADYVINPSPTSILVLIAEKSDGRLSANKSIEENSVYITCRPPYSSDDIVRWLRAELRQRNIQMDNNSIMTFATSIEPDYLIAGNELEKLIIYAKNSRRISSHDVDEVIGRSKENNIFELQNAIGKRDLKNAVKILENMTLNNEPAVYIITMLTRFFIQIWKVCALRKRSISDSEISSRYLNEVFFKYRNDYLYYANQYPGRDVKRVLSLLLQADIDAKSLNINEDMLLFNLIFNICSQKRKNG